MAALADLSGAGRHLIREIAAELQRNQLLDPARSFETVDQMLDGLERFSARTAENINTPPFDVAVLRQEWAALRADAARIPKPAIGSLELFWRELTQEAARQRRSTFALSSAMSLSAVASLPGRLLWLSRSATIAARHTGVLLGDNLMTHYRGALASIRAEGLLAYWTREYKPYLKAAAVQFSPQRESSTERLIGRL